MQKSVPEHPARLAGHRITNVRFAVKREPSSTDLEPGRDFVSVNGVQIWDDKLSWPLKEFVRGDPVGTWDSQEVPEGYNLVGFHGIMSKYQMPDGFKARRAADDGSVRLTRIGIIVAKASP